MPVSTPDPRPATTRSKRVTLVDVAAAAGCSSALVSTVINGSSTSAAASQETVQKIRRAAAALGYQADFASQSLARRSTRTIGVYVQPGMYRGLSFQYESAILRGVEAVCIDEGFDLLAINLGGDVTPDACLQRFAARRIDGLVLLHVDAAAPWVADLMDHDLNVVSINYYGDEARLRRVNLDDAEAIGLAVDHLADLGHRRIAYAGVMGGDPGPGAARRREGFERAVARRGLELHRPWVLDASVEPLAEAETDHTRYGEIAVASILWDDPGRRPPTAIVCYDDIVALGVLRGLKSRGLRAPRDVSVVGLDDIEVCPLLDPPLTTIKQPLAEMGKRATRRLFEPAPGPGGDEPTRLAEGSLVVRESTAPPPARRRRSRRPSGFTLVELLVVISIVALLISLLLPALSSARGASRDVACLSQERQLMTAILYYANDHAQTFPPGRDDAGTFEWNTLIDLYVTDSSGTTFADAGALSPVFRCPRATVPGNNRRCHYSVHPELMPRTPSDGLPAAVDDVRRTTEVVILADGRQATANGDANDRLSSVDGIFATLNPATAGDPIALGPNFDQSPSGHLRYRHGGDDVANLAFLDGHAEGFRQGAVLQRHVRLDN